MAFYLQQEMSVRQVEVRAATVGLSELELEANLCVYTKAVIAVSEWQILLMTYRLRRKLVQALSLEAPQ